MEKSLSGIFSGIFVVGILVAIIFIGFAAHDLWCGAIDLAKESFKVAGFAIFVAVLFGGVGMSMIKDS